MDKNNLKILNLLVTNSDKYFDVSEISQDIGLSEEEVIKISTKLYDEGFMKYVSTHGKIISIRISLNGIEHVKKIDARKTKSQTRKGNLFWWFMGIIGAIVAGLIIARLTGVWK